MKLFSFIGSHHHATPHDVTDEDDAALQDDTEATISQKRQGLSRWMARRKIERMQEKKRLRKSLEDYQHFALDMIKERN